MAFKKLEYKSISEKQIIQNSQKFLQKMQARRSVRHFSNKDIPIEVIKNIVMTASTAPSGANKQPWNFIIVKNADIKKKIRIAAEIEEKEFYEKRAPQSWLDDLHILGTDGNKEFLETAPYLIVVFKILYDDEAGTIGKHYYVNESIGIACGILITAIHKAGLVTLTHTPSPMRFLSKILNRKKNEKPFLLLPIGHPADDVMVPDIKRKEFDKIAEIF